MTFAVKLNDVVDAVEGAMDETSQYVDRETGEIVLLTSEEWEAAEEDEPLSDYPNWQQDSILKAREVMKEPARFCELPTQFDVHEYKIMEDFCFSLTDSAKGKELLQLIKGRGAFGRFKNAIYSLGVQDEWTDFKRDELERLAIAWLEVNEIAYTRE
jgi:hypothetical protein